MGIIRNVNKKRGYFDEKYNNALVFFIDNKNMIISKQENLIKENEDYNKLISICNNMIGDFDE